MNDIFKLFKKRAQAGKGTNITDVIKDLNEKEQNEIMGSDVGNKFDRAKNLSISKSGRLKSKKSQNGLRVLNDELFSPSSSSSSSVISHTNSRSTTSSSNKPIYVDQYSDNADSQASSSNSSFQSSLEDISAINNQVQNLTYRNQNPFNQSNFSHLRNTTSSNNTITNNNNKESQINQKTSNNPISFPKGFQKRF